MGLRRGLTRGYSGRSLYSVIAARTHWAPKMTAIVAPIETSASRQMRASGTRPASTSAIPAEVAKGSAEGAGRWKPPLE